MGRGKTMDRLRYVHLKFYCYSHLYRYFVTLRTRRVVGGRRTQIIIFTTKKLESTITLLHFYILGIFEEPVSGDREEERRGRRS